MSNINYMSVCLPVSMLDGRGAERGTDGLTEQGTHGARDGRPDGQRDGGTEGRREG